jgi:hypothetical protein
VPCNAADMHRVRTSIQYFKGNGWEYEIVAVHPKFCQINKDDLLNLSIPSDAIIHHVKALSLKYTRYIGLGSLALRSLPFYKKIVDNLLKTKQYQLIYFSTTQFPVLLLGSYWKKRFDIPFIVDIQDPWHTDYYEDKPKNQRPKKYWFSYFFNRLSERITMKNVDGLVSVSQPYIDTLIERYPRLKNIPKSIITFGAFKLDFDLASNNSKLLKVAFQSNAENIDLVYIGRGGYDMRLALKILFEAFNKGLSIYPSEFKKLRFHFIGTSYAEKGTGITTIAPIANEFGIADYVVEQTDRISFYDNIFSLLSADALMIIGSDDPQYTASKIYPYILAEKPMLAILHDESSALDIVKRTDAGTSTSLLAVDATEIAFSFLMKIANRLPSPQKTNWQLFDEYSAENMTKKQCELFDLVIANHTK